MKNCVKNFNKIIISLAITDLLLGIFKLTKEGLGCRFVEIFSQIKN